MQSLFVLPAALLVYFIIIICLSYFMFLERKCRRPRNDQELLNFGERKEEKEKVLDKYIIFIRTFSKDSKTYFILAYFIQPISIPSCFVPSYDINLIRTAQDSIFIVCSYSFQPMLTCLCFEHKWTIQDIRSALPRTSQNKRKQEKEGFLVRK